MQNPFEIANAAKIKPLAAAVRLGLYAVRLARTRKLPDPAFTAARKSFVGALKNVKSKSTTPRKDTK